MLPRPDSWHVLPHCAAVARAKRASIAAKTAAIAAMMVPEEDLHLDQEDLALADLLHQDPLRRMMFGQTPMFGPVFFSSSFLFLLLLSF